jgi:mono/diheme cytochrome c family protein
MTLSALTCLPKAALGRETSAEKAAVLTALRQVLVGLEDGDYRGPAAAQRELRDAFAVATRKFPPAVRDVWSRRLAALEKNPGPAAAAAASEALSLRDSLIADSGLDVAPALTPVAEEAQTIFKAQCAACHGVSGAGDGVLAPKMPHPPKSFAALQAKGATPLRYLNVLILGRPGTVMPSYKEKHELETLWSLAFAAAAFGRGGPAAAGTGLAGAVGAPTAKALLGGGLSLARLSRSSDAELREWVAKTVPALAAKPAELETTVSALRTTAPFSPQVPRQ